MIEARKGLNAKGYPSTYLAMGFANVRAGTQKRKSAGAARAHAHSPVVIHMYSQYSVAAAMSCGARAIDQKTNQRDARA